jgi:outer membrane protein TolC
VLNLRLAQPLLKGFGPKINRREVISAENNREISVCQLKASVLQTIYDVEEAYWNLAYAIESLKVIEYSLEQSKEMLRRYREAEKVGAKSGIEVLGSETEVANWEDQIITARLQVERNQDRLKKLLNLPTGAPDSVQTIIPIDKPSIERKELTFEEALAIALKERPEMEIAQKELDTSALDVSYYRNQLLPELNLEFRLWRPGQSGVRYLYLNDDPLTRVVVGKIIGNRMDSLKDVFRRNYNNWEVNFTLNIPLGNIISRASLARAKKESDQNLMKQARQKATIQYEVLEVTKELETNEKRINSSGRYRELMAKRLEAETQRYQLGLVGSEWLFEYQRRLAAAKTEEEKAIIDYNVSSAKLDKVLGTSLKTKNIKFREFEF